MNRLDEMLSYIPRYYLDSRVFLSILQAQGPEFDQLRYWLEDILLQFYVKWATWGLDRWEDELGLSVSPGISMEERRNRILAKLKIYGTVIPGKIKKLVEGFGCQKVNIVENFADYFFTVVIEDNPLSNNSQYVNIIEAVEEIKPAHLGFGLKVKRNYLNNLYFAGAINKGKHIIVGPANFKTEQTNGNLYFGQAIRITKYIRIGVSA